MTSTVTRSATDFLASVSVAELSTTIGLVVLALLVVALLEREIAQVAAPPAARPAARILDVVAAPLLLVFAVLIIARFVSLA